MSVREDGFYLAERVRRLCDERPLGVDPWKGREIHTALERAWRDAADQQLFYLTFLDGVRDLIDDEAGDATLVRFARQASGSEARVVADSPTTRDHLTHVTQVFLVGWLILNECSVFRAPPIEWSPYGWEVERFEKLNRAWIYTSLLHDCGYSVELTPRRRVHETRLRAMFGAMYTPTRPAALDLEACRKAGETLWERRAKLIDRSISQQVHATLRKIEERQDHAFVTGQALMREASLHVNPATREDLEIAATSLVCHNFRHSLHPKYAPPTELVEWLSLSFRDEPLAALLTVADEIQEWSRERTDLAVYRDQARKPFVGAGVALTHLEASDSAGLAIDVRLLHRLFPEDRANRERMAKEREIEIAETNRTYVKAFDQRGEPGGPFALRLRITETVEDIPCRVARRFGWPVVGRGSIRQRGEDAIARAVDRSRGYTAVATRAAGGPPVTLELGADSAGLIRGWSEGEAPIRIVLVAPGGAGKSTMLRGLARGHLGRAEIEALYVEELDDDLADLREECEALRAGAGGKPVLLLLDHLDRLVGTPSETYWLDQIEALTSVDGLHVVAACRPEEFERVVQHALPESGFQRHELTDRVGPLMEHVDGQGRVRARGIERGIGRSADDRDRLGQVALAMKTRRHLDHPALSPLPELAFADGPALLCENGKLRFAHDALQDYFAARQLAVELAAAARTGAGSAPWARTRVLFALPRDVFRLLLDLIATGKDLPRDTRRWAAIGMSRALRRDGTLRHWLFDHGRLVPAEEAIAAYRDAFADDLEVRMIADLLMALVAYAKLLPSDLGKRTGRDVARHHVSSVVTGLASALTALHRAWPAEGVSTVDDEVLATYLGDHLLTTLARAAVCDPDPAFVTGIRENALENLIGASEAGPGQLTPETIGRLVSRFDPADPIASLRALDDALGERARREPTPKADPFGLRRYQVAGHVGGTLLLIADLDATGVKDALAWHDRAATRAARVMRAMDRTGIATERFATLAHARSDQARHLSVRVYFLAYALAKGHGDRTDLRYRLLEAAQAQDEAWRAARAALQPGERLPAAHWHVHGDAALAATLVKADQVGRMSVEKAGKTLDDCLEEVLGVYQRWAERHPRFSGCPTFAFLAERLGHLGEFVARFAEGG